MGFRMLHHLLPMAIAYHSSSIAKVDRLTRSEYTCSQRIELNRDHRGPGVATPVALHKRHEFSSFIEEVLIPRPARSWDMEEWNIEHRKRKLGGFSHG